MLHLKIGGHANENRDKFSWYVLVEQHQQRLTVMRKTGVSNSEKEIKEDIKKAICELIDSLEFRPYPEQI